MLNRMALPLSLLILAQPIHAYDVTGRLTLGAYVGRERLTESSQGDFSNDVATASGRFFVRYTDVTSNRFELISDIRDKFDFFGLVDREKLQLKDTNTLQVRQLSAGYPGATFFSVLGRFPIPEAGAVFTDGGLQGVRLSSTLNWAAFGGLNPKRPEQTYLQWNSDSQVYGSYLTYTPQSQGWGKAFHINVAGVSNVVQGQTDRTYLYQNTLFQWYPRSRVNLFTYLDFLPSTYLQNGTLNFQQSIGNDWIAALNLFSIDVIQYLRIRNVRSQLASSPYKEGEVRLRYLASPKLAFEGGYLQGRRDADGLSKKESSIGTNWLGAFSRHWDLKLVGGYRDNFLSKDTFGTLSLGYFSTYWEVGLEEEYAIEDYQAPNLTYHPLTSELNITRNVDNSLFATFSAQDVRDERVQITSFFVKLTYRFGSKEIPPVRDGAPPRGRL